MTDEASIIDLLKDDSKFSAKIKQFTDGERNYLAAKSQASRSATELDRKRTETDNYVKGKMGELAARQLEHDKAAAEAAARIQAQNDQMAEILRVRDDMNRRKAQLDAQAADLDTREKALRDTLNGIAARQQVLDRSADLIRRQQAHIRAMPTT